MAHQSGDLGGDLYDLSWPQCARRWVRRWLGAAALESHIWILELPLIGNVKVVSSTFFDIGVLFVVVAVVLLILQFLGERGAALMDDSVGGES